MMQARDLFGVALRVLGVWFLYLAGYDGVFLGIKVAGLAITSSVTPTEDKLFIGYYLFTAFILLAGADKIVRLIYGPPSRTK